MDKGFAANSTKLVLIASIVSILLFSQYSFAGSFTRANKNSGNYFSLDIFSTISQAIQSIFEVGTTQVAGNATTSIAPAPQQSRSSIISFIKQLLGIYNITSSDLFNNTTSSTSVPPRNVTPPSNTIPHRPPISVTTIPQSYTTTKPTTTIPTTTIPVNASVQQTAASDITNGAQAQNWEVQMLLENPTLNKSWNILFHTDVSTPLINIAATDAINYTITKENGRLAYSLTKQTITSTLGAGMRLNYSGAYSGNELYECFGIFSEFNSSSCYNMTVAGNATKGTLALLSNLYGPMTEDTDREISASNFSIFPAPTAPEFTYHFINYTNRDGYACALLSFSSGPREGSMTSGSTPVVISANGVTCLSTSFGLPVYTSMTIHGSNVTDNVSTLNATISGTLNIANATQQSATTTIPQNNTATESNITACNEVETVYLNHTISCGNVKVLLVDLSQPNASGAASAAFNIYYNGVLTNESSISPNNSEEFTVGNVTATLSVYSTIAGLYNYQKWASVELSTTLKPTLPSSLFVVASDPSDGNLRYWEIFTDRYPGNFTGQAYANNSTEKFAELSGSSQVFSGLTLSGTHTIYLVITQAGGPSLGTYSGTVSIGSTEANFSGLDATHYLKIEETNGAITQTTVVPPQQTTGSTTVTACNETETIYVNHSITCSAFKVALVDLSAPNANGVSAAAISVYDNGELTNETTISPGASDLFTINNSTLKVTVSSTFDGLYAYQKWADISLAVSSITIPATASISINTNPPSWMANAGADFSTNVSVSNGDKVYPYSYNYTFKNLNGSRLVSSQIEQNDAEYDLLGWNYGGLQMTQGNTYTASVSVTDGNGKFLASATKSFFVNVSQSANTTNTITSITACNETEKLYINDTLSCGPFNVTLRNVVLTAALDVYYNGVLSNKTILFPHNSTLDTVSPSNSLELYVNRTYTGLYSYQKWAELKIIAVPTTYKTFGPYAAGQATNLLNVTISNVSASDVLLKEYAFIYGPYATGQATNMAGVRIGKITANNTVYLNETCALAPIVC